MYAQRTKWPSRARRYQREQCCLVVIFLARDAEHGTFVRGENKFYFIKSNIEKVTNKFTTTNAYVLIYVCVRIGKVEVSELQTV